MKKLLFVAVLGVIALSSCKKEKDCECVTSSNMPGYTSATTTATIKDGECEDSNSSSTVAGFTQTVTCKEK